MNFPAGLPRELTTGHVVSVGGTELPWMQEGDPKRVNCGRMRGRAALGPPFREAEVAAAFSSLGPENDLSAPTALIESTRPDGGYDCDSGTSFAAHR